jgi:hypothetical protein
VLQNLYTCLEMLCSPHGETIICFNALFNRRFAQKGHMRPVSSNF